MTSTPTPADPRVEHYLRWPLLLAAVTCATVAVGLDLTTQASVAYAFGALGAASFGAFLYAEGARHREWWHRGSHRIPDAVDRPPGQDPHA